MKKTPLERLLARLRRLARPTRPRRILIGLAALAVLQFALAELFARTRLLDQPPSSGVGAKLVLAALGLFLVLRVFLLVFGAGWLAARLWFWFSDPDLGRHSRSASRPARLR